MLLGQTLDGMRVWDIRRAIQACRGLPGLGARPLWLEAGGVMAGNAVYASLFEPGIARLDLHDLPATHRDGPIYLNVSRFLTMPQAVAMAAEKAKVRIFGPPSEEWSFLSRAAGALAWPEDQVQWQ